MKERIEEHKNDGEKSRKVQKTAVFSPTYKTNGHSPVWDNIRNIYGEYNRKKRKFKEAPRIISHNKEHLMIKKDERKTIPNLCNIILTDKT